MNQACGGWPVTSAVPVLPAILTPGTAALRPLPEMTTLSIMSLSTAALAGLVARRHTIGAVVDSINPSEWNTSETT